MKLNVSFFYLPFVLFDEVLSSSAGISIRRSDSASPPPFIQWWICKSFSKLRDHDNSLVEFCGMDGAAESC